MKIKKIERIALVVFLAILAAILYGRMIAADAPHLTASVAAAAIPTEKTAEANPKAVSNADITPRPTPTPEAIDPSSPSEALPADIEAGSDPAPEAGAAVLTADVPFIPQPEYGRYGNIYLHDDEVELIARVVWQEARGESAQGQQAVAEVILNRVLSPLYPDNVYDVIFDEGQFVEAPYLWSVSATQPQYDAVSAALNGSNILPQQVLYFATSMNGRTQAWGWIGGHVFCY